jgi:hypothetical protein
MVFAPRDLGGCGSEELTLEVFFLHTLLGEVPMEHVLGGHSVVRVEQGMDVEAEGHRGVSQLLDPVHGLRVMGHTDLDHVLARGSAMIGTIGPCPTSRNKHGRCTTAVQQDAKQSPDRQNCRQPELQHGMTRGRVTTWGNNEQRIPTGRRVAALWCPA